MADLIVTLLFYAFCLAGSVTTGYVLLRLTYPDVRTMEHNQKLGASAAVGAAILIISLAVCALAFDVNSIIELTSPLFLVTAIIFTLSFVSLKAYFTFLNPQKYVTVAVPIPTPATKNKNSNSINVIASIEAQTAPKTQLEKIARSATEGSTIIQVPIRKEDTTPEQLPSFEMIVPQKGDKPVVKEEKKSETTKPLAVTSTAEKKEEYVSMASPDANKDATPWWRRKRDTNQITTQPTTTITNKETPITKTQPTPAVSGDWKRPRDGATKNAPVTKSVDEVDAILADVVKDTKVKAQNQQSGSPVHRRYLLGKDSVQVIAPKTAANSTEFNEMIQDVYSQLKTAKDATPATPQTTTATVQTADKKAEDKKQPAKTTPTKPGELSIQDILGTTTTSTDSTQPTGVFAQLDAANPGEGNSLFGQLAEISGGKSKAEKAAAAAPAKQADVQNVKIQAEKDMACPTCRAKNTKIVFCPYCGSGMCANCSPKIKPVGPGQFLYTCPKCGEEINVKTR